MGETMTHLDIIVAAYIMGLFFFGLNGILWMALHNKHAELKVAEERIIRLLLRSKIRR
jgi:hypothetical protein